MPTYCFKIKKTGQPIEVFMNYSEMCRKRRDNGTFLLIHEGKKVLCERDYQTEHGGFKDTPGIWGEHNVLWSDGAGVHPDQRQETLDHAKQHGHNIKVDGEGRIGFTSARQRRAYLKSIGMHDKSSFI